MGIDKATLLTSRPFMSSKLMQGSTTGGPPAQAIQQKLTTIIQQNNLMNFYPPQALQQVVQHVQQIDFQCALAVWQYSCVGLCSCCPVQAECTRFCTSSKRGCFHILMQRQCVHSGVANVGSMFSHPGS